MTGWKTVKEHYQIRHLVCVESDGICIGSPYINDILVIGSDGRLRKRYSDQSNAEIMRYQREMDAAPDLLRQLVQCPDSFATAIKVYTYAGGEVIEKTCESLGWPNVTHDGCMMYENTYTPDKKQAVFWAKRDADIGIKFALQSVENAETALSDARSELARRRGDRVRLESQYPGLPMPSPA